MGTDIHWNVEIKHGNTWRYVPLPEHQRGWGNRPRWFFSDRSYDTFAILADVRNGYGFAGVDLGDGFKPLSEPRGIPADASSEILDCRENDGYPEDSNDDSLPVLGDHSYSWLTLKEMWATKNYWNQWTMRRGVVSLLDYEAYFKHTRRPPLNTCGSISGPEIVTISESAWLASQSWRSFVKSKDKLHIAIGWVETYFDAAWTLRFRTLPAMRGLCREVLGKEADDSKIRAVFGFDS